MTLAASGDFVKAYTFKTALTPVEGEVLIGALADDSLTNLVSAVMHTGTPDTDYKCAAAHPTVTAAAVAAHATVVTAKTKGVAGNSIGLAKVGATLTVGGATFSGGIDGTAGAKGDLVMFSTQPYVCTAAATIVTSGAWKKLSTAAL